MFAQAPNEALLTHRVIAAGEDGVGFQGCASLVLAAPAVEMVLVVGKAGEGELPVGQGVVFAAIFCRQAGDEVPVFIVLYERPGNVMVQAKSSIRCRMSRVFSSSPTEFWWP